MKNIYQFPETVIKFQYILVRISFGNNNDIRVPGITMPSHG